jgi:hypothetical protein
MAASVGNRSFRGSLALWTKRECEQSFMSFIRWAWPIIEPATPFSENWHIALIAEYLEAVTSGQIKRLLINCPPRHMKSISVSVCWPVWNWCRDPKDKLGPRRYPERRAFTLDIRVLCR